MRLSPVLTSLSLPFCRTPKCHRSSPPTPGTERQPPDPASGACPWPSPCLLNHPATRLAKTPSPPLPCSGSMQDDASSAPVLTAPPPSPRSIHQGRPSTSAKAQLPGEMWADPSSLLCVVGLVPVSAHFCFFSFVNLSFFQRLRFYRKTLQHHAYNKFSTVHRIKTIYI